MSDVRGGYEAWRSAGWPVQTDPVDPSPPVAGPAHPYLMVPEVSPLEANRLLDEGALLLDVREPEEWIAGHALGAFCLPMGRS